jgi:hypothetical protein
MALEAAHAWGLGQEVLDDGEGWPSKLPESEAIRPSWTAARIRVKNSRMCHTWCEGPDPFLLASLLLPKRMKESEIVSRGHPIKPPLHWR